MAYLLGDGYPDEEIDRLARLYIEHWAWVKEMRWHPRSITGFRVEGGEVLATAHARGRGVVISLIHHGEWTGMMPCVARGSGLPVLTVVDSASIGGPSSMQHLRVVGSAGGLLQFSVGTKGIVENLQAGHVVAVAMDLPGSGVVEIGGRRVRCASGAVHAARAADAPIISLSSRRDETGPYFCMAEVTDHSSQEDPDDLLQRLGRWHDHSLRAWPEAAYLPRTLWVEAEPVPAEPPPAGARETL